MIVIVHPDEMYHSSYIAVDPTYAISHYGKKGMRWYMNIFTDAAKVGSRAMRRHRINAYNRRRMMRGMGRTLGSMGRGSLWRVKNVAKHTPGRMRASAAKAARSARRAKQYVNRSIPGVKNKAKKFAKRTMASASRTVRTMAPNQFDKFAERSKSYRRKANSQNKMVSDYRKAAFATATARPGSSDAYNAFARRMRAYYMAMPINDTRLNLRPNSKFIYYKNPKTKKVYAPDYSSWVKKRSK